MFKRQRFQRHARKMTKKPNVFRVTAEGIVAGPMAKQLGFWEVFDPKKLQIARKIEWHKGC